MWKLLPGERNIKAKPKTKAAKVHHPWGGGLWKQTDNTFINVKNIPPN